MLLLLQLAGAAIGATLQLPAEEPPGLWATYLAGGELTLVATGGDVRADAHGFNWWLSARADPCSIIELHRPSDEHSARKFIAMATLLASRHADGLDERRPVVCPTEPTITSATPILRPDPLLAGDVRWVRPAAPSVVVAVVPARVKAPPPPPESTAWSVTAGLSAVYRQDAQANAALGARYSFVGGWGLGGVLEVQTPEHWLDESYHLTVSRQTLGAQVGFSGRNLGLYAAVGASLLQLARGDTVRVGVLVATGGVDGEACMWRPAGWTCLVLGVRADSADIEVAAAGQRQLVLSPYSVRVGVTFRAPVSRRPTPAAP